MRRLVLTVMMLVAVVSCHRNVPLIGITSLKYDNFDAVGEEYSRAIENAGAVAVVVPFFHNEKEAALMMEKLDGVVFTGGQDVQPALYGEEVLNDTVQSDTLRDRSDILLARAAMASGKPIMAICRGSQLMNVLLGGTLYQDIPTQRPDAAAHSANSILWIYLEEGSYLKDLLQVDSIQTVCGHHQAVKDPAPGLIVAARSGEGIIEAWECGTVWGLQVHAEGLVPYDNRWEALFQAFVERCR
jgi:putative glutamine amidotransferase